MVKPGKKRAARLAMSIAAAGMAASVVGLAATQPNSISASLVDLTALIVVGSSTNPTGAGVADFFGGKFTDPIYTGTNRDDIVYVDFRTGPVGIQQALDANAGERNAVLASGWGAANASLLLLANRTDLGDTVFILDNDVARPDGGFGTRYPWFALIGVNPIPTPSEVPAAAAVNIGYEYDYNSNAPADVLNPIAALNSLVGYLYTRLNQSELDLPVDAEGKPTVVCNANTCATTVSGAVLDCPDARCSSPGDRITAYVTTRNNTTYVTYTSEELPLTRLVRDVFGDQIADLTGPLLKVAVDSAYYGGNPIPRDPSAYRPARLLPAPDELVATAAKVPGAIRQGLSAATAPESPEHPSTPEPPEPSDPAKDNTRLVRPEAAEHDEPGATEIAQKRRPQLNVVRDSMKAQPGKVGDDDSLDGKPAAVQDDSVVTEPDPQVAVGPDTATDTTHTADTDTQSSGGSGDAGNDAAA